MQYMLTAFVVMSNNIADRGRRIVFDRGALEHDPEKWAPVFGKDHAQRESQLPIAHGAGTEEQ
jgi:hypothetical protein